MSRISASYIPVREEYRKFGTDVPRKARQLAVLLLRDVVAFPRRNVVLARNQQV